MNFLCRASTGMILRYKYEKKNILCLCLAVMLLVQCFAFAAAATAAQDPQTQTTETTAAPTTEPPTEPPTEAPTELDITTVPFGSGGVEYGCKSIDAKVALGGSEKLLRSAKGVFVYERNSDTVLYAYNPDQHLAPGSLVQFVSALLVLENCDLDEVITVSTYYINQLPLGVRHMSLRNGEQISVRDLLYSMLVYSANDAAMVLAQHVGGTPDRFISMMNQRVQELGCTDTVIATVSGLDDPNQYSTARDMARILNAAMDNETFREIAGSGYYIVEATNMSEPRELKSPNYLLQDAAISKFYDERVTACKASYTSTAAGASVGFAAETEDLNLICIVIGAARKYGTDSAAPSRYGNFEEAEDLMEHCFGGFHVRRLLYDGQSMVQLEVAGGANDVVAKNRSDIDIVLPTGVGLDDLTLHYAIPGGTVQAPVKAGQELATLQMWYDKCCVGETKLYAMTDVAEAERPGYTIQDGATRSDTDMSQLLIFLGIALAVILVPLALWLGFNALRKSIAIRRAKRLRRKRRDERMKRRRSRR